jgi:hypothetical protein
MEISVSIPVRQSFGASGARSDTIGHINFDPLADVFGRDLFGEGIQFDSIGHQFTDICSKNQLHVQLDNALRHMSIGETADLGAWAGQLLFV